MNLPQASAKTDLQLMLNGEPVSADGVDPDEWLVTVLRERFGCLDVKDGCSPQGECGSCTVWIDDTARTACRLRARQVAGRRVTTLAGLPKPIATAVAGAFHASCAVQCAFCLPGIAMRLGALLRDEPVRTEAEVAGALRFHVCRCVGGRLLSEAGVRAGRILAGARRPDPVPPYSPLIAAWEYPSDQAVAEGTWHLAPVLAPGPGRLASALREPPGCTLLELNDRAAHDGVILALLAGPDHAAVRQAAAEIEPDWEADAVRLSVPSEPDDLFLAPAHPGFLEPEIVTVDADTVITSSERPAGISGRRVRFRADGGAFGGKRSPWLEQLAISAADRLGRPVRIKLTREESQRIGPSRHGARGSVTLHDGRLQGTLAYVAGERSLCPDEIKTVADWCLPGPYRLGSDVRVTVETTPGSGPPSGWMRGEGSLAAVALREQALGPGLESRIGLLDPRSPIAGCAWELRDWLGDREPAGVALHVGRLPDVPAGVWARLEDGVLVHPYSEMEPWRIGPQRGTGELGPCPTGGGWPFVLVSMAHGAKPGGPGVAVAADVLTDAARQIASVLLVIDAGGIQNPALALSHVHGAAHMGLGAALSERIRRAHGVTESRTLRSLGILPVSATPPVHVRFRGDGPPLAGLADACVAPVAAAAMQALGASRMPVPGGSCMPVPDQNSTALGKSVGKSVGKWKEPLQ